MKKLIGMATIATAISTIATTDVQAKVVCKPLIQDMQAQKAVVENFATALSDLEKKAGKLDQRISEKVDKINAVKYKIDIKKDSKAKLENDKVVMLDSVSSINSQKDYLISENIQLSQKIQDLKIDIQNLPARSVARRNALREMKRAEKKIESNEYKVQALETQIAPVMQTVASIDSQISQVQSQIQRLKAEKKAVQDAKPSISFLKNKKNEIESQLIQQDTIQQTNLAVLDELSEKAMVCKTYKVKYPLVLQITKELYDVGCEAYTSKNYKNYYKNLAETEALNAVCD